MHVDEISEMIRAKIEIVGGKALYVSSFYNAKTSNCYSLWDFLSWQRPVSSSVVVRL
jgi:hypothetical protein